MRASSTTMVVTMAHFACQVHAEPRTTLPLKFKFGDCITQRLVFSNSRVLILNGADSKRFTAERSEFDFTLDYGTADFSGTAVQLNLRKSARPETDISLGARMSTTRYLKYGRITARFNPAVDPGVVSTLVTWSDFQNEIRGTKEVIQDEIDWEVVGKDPTRPEYNVFTGKANQMERGIHGGPVDGRITSNVPHDFTIDWRSDRIEWGVDGKVMKTLLKSESKAALPGNLKPGEAWFPETPSRVQISVWDGSFGAQRQWAGGPIPWSDRTQISVPFEWLQIQCYDDQDRPVGRWAADGSGPSAENGTDSSKKTLVTGVRGRGSPNGQRYSSLPTPTSTLLYLWTPVMAIMGMTLLLFPL
ncbi:hypothetical protein BASA50_009003 [Batrachochytrium salamandrivorans]|uniref:GH16 domain-containing protein n=1 Tax=Batrachochytrium salamandrivorans TaxID=1357716 RepID=A0ABQ8F2J3_9FUNG|nr:hypothetical protein BASA62_000067 [Batrachochytrium salamandrivorans]KAH6573054.1 hypothetical protein BASA60_006221 [Batrachochytrium salamandrivorans]KAH6578434.1 hypothetical protein BASA61_000192 [Batrachochytrium salamandrivorans]KAH6591002.1 hypothetical protein BASA50_009003 [Batrachochytrium salamandrivorans]KAH9277271.1 hypothetical protein BASA83_000138 [Batrachochytrium salamandrivorans]